MAESLSCSNESLHLTTKCGDEEAVASILKQIHEVDAVDREGCTALHYACQGGFLSIAKLLLDDGASLDAAQIGTGKKALHFAAERGDEDIVGLLLKNGADVHAVDKRGYTALIYAAYTPSENTVKQLLSYGADVSAATPEGNTALSIACISGSSRHNISILLIRNGADVHWVDRLFRGLTLVHYAAQRGMIETLQLLLDMKVDVDALTYSGETALHRACKRLALNGIECLLQNGAQVSYPGRKGFTALHFVVVESRYEVAEYVQVVELLFKYEADVNAEDDERRTPLVLALHESRTEMVKVFVKQLMNMKSRGLFVSENNLKAISENEVSKSFSASCEEELEKMRKTAIGDSSVKFYDIFTKGANRLADFVSNDNVELVLESENYRAEFPIYASAICENFLKGRERRDLLRQSCDWLWDVISEFYDLPYVCVQRINRFLTNTDLALQISYEPPNKKLLLRS